jgi:hypothetical protein
VCGGGGYGCGCVSCREHTNSWDLVFHRLCMQPRWDLPRAPWPRWRAAGPRRARRGGRTGRSSGTPRSPTGQRSLRQTAPTPPSAPAPRSTSGRTCGANSMSWHKPRVGEHKTVRANDTRTRTPVGWRLRSRAARSHKCPRPSYPESHPPLAVE